MSIKRSVKRKLGPHRVAALKRWVAPVVRRDLTPGRDLTLLGKLYGTNKASGRVGYTRLYERHLASRRRNPMRILEIGVGGYAAGLAGGGSSLRMWRSYFPKGEVFGIDLEERDLRDLRIRTFQGNQADESFLLRVAREAGPFDLIVDDGSHISADIITSLGVLWPHVAREGWYVIEDTHTSYLPEFGGGPPGQPGTTLELVKGLVDYLHAEGADLAAMHVYPRITFLEKC